MNRNEQMIQQCLLLLILSLELAIEEARSIHTTSSLLCPPFAHWPDSRMSVSAGLISGLQEILSLTLKFLTFGKLIPELAVGGSDQERCYYREKHLK